MIPKLQRHLTLLFTGATGLILTLVLAVAFIYQFRLNLSQNSEQFQSQLLDLTHRLEGTSSFSDDWLAKLEADSCLIISIEDNGRPLFFPGSWTPPTDREFLIDLAKKEAEKEGVSTDAKPYASSLSKSSVFSLKGKHLDTYQGTVMVLSTEGGFRSLTLLSETSHIRRTLLLQLLLFLVLEGLGVFSLFLVSRRVVKKAVHPLEEYHQKQTEFIAAASHELRSPLAVMQTSASAILAMPDQALKMAESIQKECIRAGSLIKNLLLLSSADAGTFEGEIQPMEIDTLLLQLFENYEPLCRAKNIRLSLLLPDEFLPKVSGNSQWVYQILSILLDNAVAYGCSGEKPAIQLSAECRGQSLFVRVTDHGPGIPDPQKDQIFLRFYRGDKSRSAKEHSGLGLSIAKTLADRMSLALQVTDTPGGGAAFQLTFPNCFHKNPGSV